MTGEDLLARVRAICGDLPEVIERPSHGAPGFYVRGKKQFVHAWIEGHHGDTFPHLWCAAPPGMQAALVAGDGDRYFRPPYVGSRGWVGVRLDRDPDWDEVADLCETAYRWLAPKTLVAGLDARDAARPPQK